MCPAGGCAEPGLRVSLRFFMNITEISIRTAGGTYAVCLGEGLLDEVGALTADKAGLSPDSRGGGRRAFLLSDSTVGPLYADRVSHSLHQAGYEVTSLAVPAGESSKSLTVVEEVANAAIAAGLDRTALLVALGGGVVGDLGGFVAGILFRGIPFVQIPTTIVAQVDSAVGGKTGVNTAGGKNLLGVFHQPRLVVADPLVLQTLPDREFCEGFAEVVKHAVIRDASLLQAIRPGVREGLTDLLARNVRIKAAIVEADEQERTGERALLNFGHTVGHAIENAAGYGRWFHGEAVSLGLVAALRLSRQVVGLSEEEEAEVRGVLQSLGLPIDFREAPSTAELIEAMRSDKKFEGGHVRFVLTPRLGSAVLSKDITYSAIAATLEELRAEAQTIS